MASSSLLRERSRALPKLLSRLSLIRSMGGGPRTFPGGLNKWQYKRMHEKMARQKERRLLQQEKQLYQARLRSEIRAKLAGKASTDAAQDSSSSIGGYGPMSSEDHIKALADRFTKEGAEDLWNEDDGPIRSAPRKRPTDPAPPLDLRKLVADRRNLMDDRVGESRSSLASFDQRRQYSILAGRGLRPGSKPRWRRNSSSEEDSDTESGFNLEGDTTKMYRETKLGVKKDSRFPRFSIGGEKELEEELDEGGGRIARKKMMSGAALGNYDVKTEKRVPRHVEERSNFANEIEEIRSELRARDLFRNGPRQHRVQEETLFSKRRFDECSISPLTIKALADAKYVQMTVVQEAALPVCLEGKDALVKAKTGTGKSVSFLLPAIEAVLKATSNSMNQRVLPINVLILCPTRELAIQIAAETNVLLKYHDGVGVQTLIGGTRFKLDQKRLDSNPCQIIVATPGRLLDHIENKSGFSARLMGLKLLILDEADHLLDLGFRKDIENIVDSVPRQRQSLLFSATIPKEVRRISQLVLKRDHVFVDTVGLTGVDAPIKVLQSCLVAPHELHFHLVYHLLKEHIMHEPDCKVIVFCTTAMVTTFMYVLLRDLKMNVREMHSRKPQLYRSRISEEFQESKNIILVTSDVSARGMNYPDVTLVIQVGIPSDHEQYIHRLGRTGREGKDGKGILLLAPWEEYFMDDVNDLPIKKSVLPKLESDMKQKIKINPFFYLMQHHFAQVEDSIEKIDPSIKESAYHAWLGYYNSISEIGRDKTMLTDLANRFCHSIGLDKTPALFRKTVMKMGLKGIPGIRVRK